MIDQSTRRKILAGGRPQTLWQGEQMLGSACGEAEIEAAVTAMRESGDISVGFGFSCQQILDFEAAFAEYTGTRYAIAINSCGPGLDMAMRYLELAPGDEVIVPAINFIAVPLAVIGAGGQVIWAEVDERTLQLDPDDVARRITPRTRAIVPTHMNGLSAPMDELLQVAGGIPVIGDAARACGGSYKGAKIGKHGLLTAFSLHTMKNITTLGEGGMITTDDKDVADFCRSTRFYGDGARWGSSYVMTKVQAAVGLVQLRNLDSFIRARRRLGAERSQLLAEIPELQTADEPEGCEHTYYLYTCTVCRDWAGDRRNALITLLRETFGVATAILNRPCYVDNAFIASHTEGQRLPLSDELGERILCLPMHPAMTTADNEYIAASVIECIEQLRN